MLMLIPLTGFLLCGVALTNGYYTDPHCQGDTRAIVYMFEWTWPDIERECPLLADIGYCGIQVSIPTEHFTESGAWWERSYTVSYKLESMSGSEVQFRSMVKACSDAGVRVFVSMQLNGMTDGEGVGYNGTVYNGDKLDYPGVPYTEEHFHGSNDCPGKNVYKDSPTIDIQGCPLNGPDLAQSNSDVRRTMSDLLNSLLGMGVAGFFMEDAYYIAPDDIKGILEAVHDVQSGGRPFFTHMVYTTLDSKQVMPQWYFDVGRVTDFKMSEVLGESLMTRPDLSDLCSTLATPSLIAKENALIFVDDPTYQRGYHPRGGETVTFKNRLLYEVAQSFVLASDYGVPRIMSSYSFSDIYAGRPRGGSCGDGWICEHRWSAIEGMVKFSNILRGQSLQNCLSTSDNVTFTRGDTGYYWASLEALDTETIVASLPAGQYWEAVSNQTGSVLDESGTTTLDFSGQRVVALIYKGPLVPTAAPTTEKEKPKIDLTTLIRLAATTAQTTPIAETTQPQTTPTAETTQPQTTPIAETTQPETTPIAETTQPETTPIAETTQPETTPIAETTQPETTPIAETTQPETTPIAETTVTKLQTTPNAETTKLQTTPIAETTKLQTTPIALTTQPTTTRKTSDVRRTVIFIKRETEGGQSTFLRGGYITGGPIPIRHTTLTFKHGAKERDTWAYGDNFLDWDGREDGQNGVHKGQKAKGTPMQWTSSNGNDWYYHSLNTYGGHYWVVDVYMDCLKTRGGFFQVKGYSSDGANDAGRYEPGLILGQKCKGGDDVPWSSRNHWAMCGKINVFTWGEKDCKIKNLP